MVDLANSRVWTLVYGRFVHGKQYETAGFLITPKDVDQKMAESVWSYALRHTAKGLDEPDVLAAMALIKQHRPDWDYIPEIQTGRIAYNPDNIPDSLD